MTNSVRLQYCAECGKDYPATRFRRSPVRYVPGVTGWLCPRGHEATLCDAPELHSWLSDGAGEISEHCTRCYASRLALQTPRQAVPPYVAALASKLQVSDGDDNIEDMQQDMERVSRTCRTCEGTGINPATFDVCPACGGPGVLPHPRNKEPGE